MRTAAPGVFLGRQAIFDRALRLIGYELLFRTGEKQGSTEVSDDALATARVIANAFRKFGIHTVVGQSRAFINFDAELLLSNVVETLPPDRVVLELLETVTVDERILLRCRKLKSLGYRLALDDFFAYHESCDPLLDIVDIVKIDLLRIDQRSLMALVERLKLRRTILLAEKVDSRARARACLKLGFDLFQGYFFGQPDVLTA